MGRALDVGHRGAGYARPLLKIRSRAECGRPGREHCQNWDLRLGDWTRGGTDPPAFLEQGGSADRAPAHHAQSEGDESHITSRDGNSCLKSCQTGFWNDWIVSQGESLLFTRMRNQPRRYSFPISATAAHYGGHIGQEIQCTPRLGERYHHIFQWAIDGLCAIRQKRVQHHDSGPVSVTIGWRLRN
jgi:hypothetical protein